MFQWCNALSNWHFWAKNDGENRCHFHAIFKSYMPFQRYELIYPPKAFRRVKSAVPLKWQVGFENGTKMTPIFTIIFSSKMLIWQCITSLEHTFFSRWPEFTLGNIVWYVLKLWGPCANLKWMKCFIFLLFYNALDLNNQKILWLPSIYQFERTATNLNHPICTRYHLRIFQQLPHQIAAYLSGK